MNYTLTTPQDLSDTHLNDEIKNLSKDLLSLSSNQRFQIDTLTEQLARMLRLAPPRAALNED